MRAKAAIGGVGAAALVAAVVLLRGQVEPSVAGPTTTVPPSATTATAQLLPVRPVEQRPRWRTYPVPPDTAMAMADPEYVVLIRGAGPSGGSQNPVITVRSRDGSGREVSYRPEPAGWEPANWLIMDGHLFVMELRREGDAATRLMRVDLGSGRADHVPVHSVRLLGPSLLAVGDELIASGVGNRDASEKCVVALRPSTGAERIVVCGLVQPILEAADGGVVINMPDTSADGCSIRLLLPGQGQFGLPVFVGYCRQRRIIPLSAWQVSHIAAIGELSGSLLASDGGRQLVLGTVKISAAACHGWLYWVSGGRPDSPFGNEVRRWNPGAGHVEVIHRAGGDTELGSPICASGSLSVRIVTESPAGSRLAELLVLDRA